MAPKARDYESAKEEGRRFHRTCSKELLVAHSSPWAFSLVAISMQTVHESEAAVETSSHCINGKPKRTGRVEFAFDRGRHVQRRLHAQSD